MAMGKTRPTETGKPVHRIEHFGEISVSSVLREAESGIGGERLRRVRRAPVAFYGTVWRFRGHPPDPVRGVDGDVTGA